jgi:uncharacterized phage protein (TIGR01671 family)
MKELKFRAFHKPSKKMFDVVQIDFINKFVFSYERIYSMSKYPYFDTVSYLSSECELMQFTGLKDVDGKDIFEGDIIQDINDNNSLRYGKDNNLTPVEFYNASFGISVIFDGAFVPLYPYDEAFKFKVVGNIYQNSELL